MNAYCRQPSVSGDHGSAPLVVLVGVKAAPAMTVEAHTGVAVPVALVADEGRGSCWTYVPAACRTFLL